MYNMDAKTAVEWFSVCDLPSCGGLTPPNQVFDGEYAYKCKNPQPMLF